MMANTAHISQNLKHIHERIGEAALRSGRAPVDVRLVAVSKTHPADAVIAAYHAGQRDFAENRPEDGQPKIVAVNDVLHADDIVWHMIGHIQSRKAKLVIPGFKMVQSVDRISITQKLSDLAVQNALTLPVLLECNVSGETSKQGFAATGWEQDSSIRQALVQEFSDIIALPGLRVQGLMTMAPFVDDEKLVRGAFISLRSLRDLLRESLPAVDWQHLSMGMSGDFELAIEEGATIVRIGTAIFGHRDYQ